METFTLFLPMAARRLLHRQQFDIEHQRGVGRNDQRALAADLHRGDPLIPAGDNLLLPDREFERLVAIDRTVELLALLAIFIEPAGIVHDADLAGLRRRAVAD